MSPSVEFKDSRWKQVKTLNRTLRWIYRKRLPARFPGSTSSAFADIPYLAHDVTLGYHGNKTRLFSQRMNADSHIDIPPLMPASTKTLQISDRH